MKEKSISGSSCSQGLNDCMLLTRQEAARILKISPRTLDRMREECRGPRWIDLAGGVRKKPQIRYRLVDLQQYLDDLAS